MSTKVIRCKHLRLLKECVSCSYGVAVGERLHHPLMTEHERKKGGRALRLLLQYRASILGKKPSAVYQPTLRQQRGMLAIVIECRFSYEDLVLAYRVLILKGQRLGLTDSADRMRTVLVAKFLPN